MQGKSSLELLKEQAHKIEVIDDLSKIKKKHITFAEYLKKAKAARATFTDEDIERFRPTQ